MLRLYINTDKFKHKCFQVRTHIRCVASINITSEAHLSAAQKRASLHESNSSPLRNKGCEN